MNSPVPQHVEHQSQARTEELLLAILQEMRFANKNTRLWDLDDLADYFNLEKSSVSSRLVCKSNFPKAIKIEGVGRRWQPSEVKAYAEKHKVKRVSV